MQQELEQIKSAMEAANTALDNIAQDNVEQMAKIEELLAKLSEAQVPQELITLAEDIKAKAQKISEEWPDTTEGGGEGEGA